jgi:hypothetical protein
MMPAVKVRAERAILADAGRPRDGERSRRLSWTGALLLAGILAGLVLALYLSIYPAKGFAVPMGYDTPEYVWRTKLAQQIGISDIEGPVPSLGRVKRGRPAYPAVAGTLSSLEDVDPFDLAKVLPAAAAAALALAAGVFAGSVLRRGTTEVAVIVLAVGASPFMVLLMAPESYVDTMFALALFLAAAIPIARLPDERRAVLPAALLLGTAGLIHFQFFLLMLVTLGAVAVAWLPESWRRWRSGSTGWLDTPAVRLGVAAAGGTAFSWGLLYGVLGNSIPKTRSDTLEFAKKLARDLPEYRFPITGPLAALGAGALLAESRRRPARSRLVRSGLTFLLAWGLVVLVGYVAGAILDLTVPAHRFLSFALTVPLLGAVGVLWAARALARWWRPLALALVAAGLVWTGYGAHAEWFRNRPWIETNKIEQAGTVASYLQAAGVPAGRPVVFVVGTRDPNGAGLMGHEIRAAIPPERIRHTYLFVGSGDDFLARRAEPDPVSHLYLRRMGDVFDDDPVAVITSSYNDAFFEAWVAAHPDSAIAPNVAVVQGPPPPASLPPTAPAGVSVARVPPVWEFGLMAAGAFAILTLAGLGWAAALPRRWLRPLEVMALAPTMGLGALILGAVSADRLGFRPSGLSGALTPVAVGLAGAALALWTARRSEASEPGRGTEG